MIEETIKSILNEENTYIGLAPVDVDNCQWIKSQSGGSIVHFGRTTFDKPEYAIFVRNKSNKDAHEIVKRMYDKLKNYVGTNFVILIERLPHYVGRDEKYRSIYSFRIQYQLGGY